MPGETAPTADTKHSHITRRVVIIVMVLASLLGGFSVIHLPSSLTKVDAIQRASRAESVQTNTGDNDALIASDLKRKRRKADMEADHSTTVDDYRIDDYDYYDDDYSQYVFEVETSEAEAEVEDTAYLGSSTVDVPTSVITPTHDVTEMQPAETVTSQEITAPPLPDQYLLTVALETTTPQPDYSTVSHDYVTDDFKPHVPAGDTSATADTTARAGGVRLKEPPQSWKPDPTIFTSPQVQKIAEEYLNSMTWHSSTSQASVTSDGDDVSVPSTAPSPPYDDTSRTGVETSTDEHHQSVKDDQPETTTPGGDEQHLYTRYNIPTARPLPPACFREAFRIRRVCELSERQRDVAGESVTLEDVAQMIFVKATLNLLKVRHE